MGIHDPDSPMKKTTMKPFWKNQNIVKNHGKNYSVAKDHGQYGPSTETGVVKYGLL